jgi:hypothetical protein
MKTSGKVISVLALTGLLAACSNGMHRSEQMAPNSESEAKAPKVGAGYHSNNSDASGLAKTENAQTADSAAGTYMSSSAAVERGKDTSRRFIRTADLHFRVKNVIKATYTIEDIVNRFGGIVTYTHLQSNLDNSTLIPVSPDSSLETTYFTMVNTITLRVPVTKLDTTLKSMAPLVDFLDYRTIKAENVSFSIFADMLEQQLMAQHNERMGKHVDNSKTTKLNDITAAEDNITNYGEEANRVKVDIFRREDSIKYSVVTMYIYQRQTFRRVLIPNDKNIAAYEPSFGHKFISAIEDGWGALLSLIIGLTQIWSVLLILALVAYFAYLFYKKRKG